MRYLHLLFRGVLARLPGFPRCKLCNRPLEGWASLSAIGLGPSRKNPLFCTFCFERLPLGGTQIDIAVLFADVRGSTGLGERLAPAAFAALMNRFYRLATDVLVAHGAIVDKLVGDEVVALFVPGLSGPGYRGLAARAGAALVRALGHGSAGGPLLGLGVGVHAGEAFVGNVGAGSIADFTALGDTVNTAARLRSAAASGEVVMSEAVYAAVVDAYPGLLPRTVELRGRTAPVAVRVIEAPSVGAATPGS